MAPACASVGTFTGASAGVSAGATAGASAGIAAGVPVGAPSGGMGLFGIRSTFRLMNMPFSHRLFMNAMGDGDDLFFGETREMSYDEPLPAHIADQIRQEPSFARAEADVLQRAGASGDGAAAASYNYVVVETQNDAYYALHGFYYGVELEAEQLRDGVYKVYVAAKDRYHFKDIGNTCDCLTCTVLRYAYVQQEMGNLKNFDVTIGFSYVTPHTHVLNRINEGGYCILCNDGPMFGGGAGGNVELGLMQKLRLKKYSVKMSM
ncbi:MAG: hypothetical protein FWH01_12210 [Oscillospiraceae bacterium]|nr:hypothetical protein [Oscillospiraceae bacterium]